MATKANLYIYQGDDFAADITVLQDDGVTPADLTGYTAQSQIKCLGCTDGSVVAQFTTAIVGNVITILLDHTTATNLVYLFYVWDIQVIDPNGWVTTLLAGQVVVSKEVTQYEPSRALRAGAFG